MRMHADHIYLLLKIIADAKELHVQFSLFLLQNLIVFNLCALPATKYHDASETIGF